jgi:hypothetical protein
MNAFDSGKEVLEEMRIAALRSNEVPSNHANSKRISTAPIVATRIERP